MIKKGKIDLLIRGVKNPDKVVHYFAAAFSNPRKFWVNFHPILWDRLHPRKRAEIYKILLPYFQGKKGVRIGGSLRWEFQRLINYSADVIDVDIAPFHLGQPTNPDYLTDATNLYFAKNGEFDFVCSSHVLEHISNPIKALLEWIRVIRKRGVIYCGIPDKRFTFDHRRQRTPLLHLIDDYKNNIDQSDTTHIQDLVDNWDENMDWCGNRQQFTKNIYEQPQTIHHHVWIKKDVVNLFKYVGLEIIFVVLIGDTIHIVGKKIKDLMEYLR